MAYYRREWAAFPRSAITLTRHTFGLSWPSTIRGAWLVLRANQLWAPYPDRWSGGACIASTSVRTQAAMKVRSWPRRPRCTRMSTVSWCSYAALLAGVYRLTPERAASS